MAKKIRKIETITEFHRMRGLPSPSHPLVSLVDYGKTTILSEHLGESWHFSFYSIGMKRNVGTVRYGQQQYDFDEGFLSFIAPGQLLSIQPNKRANLKPTGSLLLLHPNFIWKTSLAKNIQQYDFFDYAINEALFLSTKEEQVIKGILANIEQEIESNIDSFSQNIIIAQIELLLNYAERFYQRQFITRKKNNHEILDRLEQLLNEHFQEEQLTQRGLPSVQYVAQQL
ncbi:MAG: AraC family transcriptional regulator, partial [Bacteroidota bacterium]